MNQGRNERGMTLLEMVLALTLIAGVGFTLLVKVPVRFQHQHLILSSTQLLEDLRETRQRAMAENTWYQVKFYLFPESHYQILRQGTMVKDVYLQDGVRFLNKPNDLIFSASGIPTVGMTIVLETKDGERKSVILAPVTGRTREL